MQPRRSTHKSCPGALGREEPVVLDVRPALEVQAEGIIAGSLHIPMNEVPGRLARSPAEGESSPLQARPASWNVAQCCASKSTLQLSGGLAPGAPPDCRSRAERRHPGDSRRLRATAG